MPSGIPLPAVQTQYLSNEVEQAERGEKGKGAPVLGAGLASLGSRMHCNRRRRSCLHDLRAQAYPLGTQGV